MLSDIQSGTVILKEGILLRRVQILRSSISVWQKRQVYLTTDELIFSGNLQTTNPSSKNIALSSILSISLNEYDSSFVITTKLKSVVFKASDLSTARQWMMCLASITMEDDTTEKLGSTFQSSSKNSETLSRSSKLSLSRSSRNKFNRRMNRSHSASNPRRNERLFPEAAQLEKYIQDALNEKKAFVSGSTEEANFNGQLLESIHTENPYQGLPSTTHDFDRKFQPLVSNPKSNGRNSPKGFTFKKDSNLQVPALINKSNAPTFQTPFQTALYRLLNTNTASTFSQDCVKFLKRFRNDDDLLLVWLIESIRGRLNEIDLIATMQNKLGKVSFLSNSNGHNRVVSLPENLNFPTDFKIDDAGKMIVEACKTSEMSSVFRCFFGKDNPKQISLVLVLYWFNLDCFMKNQHICRSPLTCDECIQNRFEKFALFVRRYVGGYKLKIEHLNVLFCILIENSWSFDDIETLSADIRQPGIWKAIWYCLEGADENLKAVALKKSMLIFIKRHDYVRSFAIQEDWIMKFGCALLDWPSKTNTDNRKLLFQFISIIFRHLFIVNFDDKLSFSFQLRQSLARIVFFFRSEIRMAHRTLLTILLSFVNNLFAIKSTFPIGFDDQVWINLIELCDIIEIFLFHTSFLSEHPIEDKKVKLESTTPFHLVSIFNNSIETNAYVGVHFDNSRKVIDLELAQKMYKFLQSFRFENISTQPMASREEKEIVKELMKRQELYADILKALFLVEKNLSFDNSELDTISVQKGEIEQSIKRFALAKSLRGRKSAIKLAFDLNVKPRKSIESPSQKKEKSSQSYQSSTLSERRFRSPIRLRRIFERKSLLETKSVDVDELKSAILKRMLVNSTIEKGDDSKQIENILYFTGEVLTRVLMEEGICKDERNAEIIGESLLCNNIIRTARSTSKERSPFRNSPKESYFFVQTSQSRKEK